MDGTADWCGQCPISLAARAIGEKQLEVMSRQVIRRLRDLPATGVMGDDWELRTIWDEYCFDQQYGPAEMLEDGWDSLLNPIIAELTNALNTDEKYLCSAAADCLVQDFDPSHGWNSEVIMQGVRDKLASKALDQPLDWCTDF